MKKKQIFLKTIVAITLLSAMLVSAFLGTSNAEYFKSLNKTLSLEMKPDLNLSYYLKDSEHTSGTTGTYKNANSFTQVIIPGNGTKATEITSKNVYYSPETIYQVKIPVDEEGYYTLDFNSNFLLYRDNTKYDTKDGWVDEFYTVNAKYCVGCEVVTATDSMTNDSGVTYDTFGNSDQWNMPYRVFGIDHKSDSVITGLQNIIDDPNAKSLLYSDSVIKDSGYGDSVYQWKTLAPSREENVKLTFKVTDKDVAKGYVVWMWDLTGLIARDPDNNFNHQYTLCVNSLSVNKIMNLDGTSKNRSDSDPYFMFPQTAVSNNYFVASGSEAGKTHYSNGRGTYVTEATENSLGLRAEILYDDENNTGADGKQNPLSLYIPLKNIQFDKTYKVTFDLSIAKQGNRSVDNTPSGASSSSNWYDYDAFDKILRTDTDTVNAGGFTNNGRACWSYLFSHSDSSEILYRQSYSGHNDFVGRLRYADKYYQGKPLTQYDGVTTHYAIGASTSTSVNDTYSKNLIEGNEKAQSRNWYNAVEHTEYNGQNAINWLTFYNTTFSFNISSANKNSAGQVIDNDGKVVDLDNLYWIWMIDFLKYTAYYNIRLDNVRIEEVVQYGSMLDRNGVKIAGTMLTLENSAQHWDHTTDNEDERWVLNGLFVSFRGNNGTGQNWNVKGFHTVKENNGSYGDASNITFTNAMNIYAPIIDARNIPAVHTDNMTDKNGKAIATKDDDYKITLDGVAICEGGIDRYVFSVDGGNTWYDMTFTGGDTVSTQWTSLARCVNQHTAGQTNFDTAKFDKVANKGTLVSETTFANFTAEDAQNGDFSNWGITADLSAFKHQANLDIIIAAVPESNPDFRCEILRIINYNYVRDYATFVSNIISDIYVTNNNTGLSNEEKVTLLNARYDRSDKKDENKEDYSYMRGVTYSGSVSTAKTGYSSRTSYSNDLNDVRTLFSDIPVKTTLKLQGFAMITAQLIEYEMYDYPTDKNGNKIFGEKDTLVEVKGCYEDLKASEPDGSKYSVKMNEGDTKVRHALRGVDTYYWSVDGGKTWKPCADEYGGRNNGGSINSTYSTFGNAWYPNNPNTTAGYYDLFNGSGKYISANLSAYEGQVVDVLFAAKPNKSDVYVPVAKVDNVAVYGEYGTFYTRVHRVIIDGRTNENLSGDVNVEEIEQTHSYNSNDYLNFRSKWNINFSEKSYAIFEPQNVNAVNSKYITNVVQEIESAGRVAIDGYVMCKGGVSRYKFSLDGGETWTVINDTGTDMSDLRSGHSMISYSQRSDSSFNANPDGDKGNFCCTGLTGGGNSNSSDPDVREAFYDHALEFNIPALPQGAQRDLLVVAESTRGKDIPVLHMKIRVKNTQYGYQNIANKAKFSTIQAGYTTSDRSWEFDPAFSNVVGENNKTLNRITIPVTETGGHTITFYHTISNPAVTKTETKRQLYNNDANAQSGRYTDITLSVPKTHFAYGEEIGVNFTCGFNSSTKKANRTDYGTVTLAIISNDWKNHNGEQHAIRSQIYTPGIADGSLDKVSFKVDDIRKLSYENAGLTESSKGFRAGSYSILLIHTPPEGGIGELSNILITKKYRDAFILAEIPIYIHEEGVEFSAVHDEGKYTYFSDVSRQLSAGDDNVYTIATLPAAELFATSGTVAKKISGTVNVTEGDVRRGYIVLDTNYTGLWAGNKHTHDECIKEPPVGYGTEWGEHEYDPNCNVKEHEHEKDKHYAEHTHTDDKCLSRNLGNGSTFYKVLPGKELRQIFSNGEVVSTMKHPGITYTVNISLGDNALVKNP